MPSAAAATATMSPQALAASYQLCIADLACATHFSMSAGAVGTEALNAQMRFQEILPIGLAAHTGIGAPLADAYGACVANATAAPACDTVTELWLALLRETSACDHANEVWVVGEGCVCKNGHKCDDCDIGVKVSDLWSFVVLLIVVALGAVVAFVWQTRHVMQIERNVEQQQAAFTESMYHNQAALWFYDVRPDQRENTGITNAPVPYTGGGAGQMMYI